MEFTLKDYVAGTLPREAANELLRAALEARKLPEDSKERRIVMDKAINGVRQKYARYFRDRN